MIGTEAALAFSRNSPMAGMSLDQICLGSWQRLLRSRTRRAVLLPSSVKGFGSGLFGPSCYQDMEASSRTDSTPIFFRSIVLFPLFSFLLLPFCCLLRLAQTALKVHSFGAAAALTS